ncbi:GAF domain-containing sensor histidine kinase [Leifsonia sp. LS-T14]|uniref:GAF domain-containing sensor histidine kinase n=1 Tax=unclassified Leifsonia TaxID=2663824 RepID=UPI0035A6AED8
METSAAVPTDQQDELRRLLHEEQSLRNVATLLATAGPTADILTAICREASAQLDGQEVSLLRFEAPDTVVCVATHDGPIPPGVRAVHSPGSLPERVATLRSAVRVDDFTGHSDEELVAPFGIRAAVAVPVFVDGEVWGMFSASSQSGPLAPHTEARLAGFAQLTWAAIANTEVRDSLRRSRARVIAAADEARRRLQRDVHDGAQQRLVHTIISLKLARDRAAAGLDVADLLDEALANAEEANLQLRDIVRGILPASLTRAGLAAGIESLVADAPIPVELDLAIPRLPVSTETTGYFTVAEAMTNAVKHAQATRVRIAGAVTDVGDLRLVFEDDGVGGADSSRGTGLTGLADRIEAAGGTITVVSPPGDGTRLVVHIPTAGPVA